MNKYCLITLLAFFSLKINAQNLSIGQWSEHLPYLHAHTLADGGNKVFCATDDGLFAYHKDDNSLQRFSKLSGLNDFGVATIAYSTTYHTLIVAYVNSNIDLVNDDGSVFNLSDIERKNIPGNKAINKIRTDGRYAYLSCGFGIVVVDLQKLEIKDTYHPTTDSITNNVHAVVSDANWFYAATDSGIYRAPVNDPTLGNFNVWTRVFKQTGRGYFSLIESFSNTIITNFVSTDNSGNYISDNVFSAADGISWTSNVPAVSGTDHNYSFHVSDNLFLVTNNSSVRIFDIGFNQVQQIDGTTYANAVTRDAFKDNTQTSWIADHDQGLIKLKGTAIEKIHPDGPSSSLVSDLGIEKGVLWMTHSGKDGKWSNSYRPAGISKFKDNQWSSYDKYNVVAFDTTGFFDNMSLAVDPNDPLHVYIGSAGDGLMDFYNDNVRTYYRQYNSTLLPMVGNPGQVKVHGLSYDKNGNLWMVNSGTATFVNVLKSNGQWKRFDLSRYGNPFAGKLFIDSYNQLFVQIYGNSTQGDGLLAFNINNTIDNTADDLSKLLIDSAGRGNLPDNGVYTMAEDQQGQVWLGTGKGIGVMYSPSAIFSGSNYDAQQILIKQDNTYQYLLATETVTALAVDGSDRKWVGTLASGLYLFSSDGLQEIHHFTPDNSPLFSNNITALAIDKITGQIYIGTDKGLISYQSDAIEGDEKCQDVIVYPNPVRENYTGPIAIRGVVSNSIIKITDVSGTLVYEGKALGGQAVWSGKNFKGKRAQTGVYLVFSSDEEGKNSCVTKLLLVN